MIEEILKIVFKLSSYTPNLIGILVQIEDFCCKFLLLFSSTDSWVQQVRRCLVVRHVSRQRSNIAITPLFVECSQIKLFHTRTMWLPLTIRLPIHTIERVYGLFYYNTFISCIAAQGTIREIVTIVALIP